MKIAICDDDHLELQKTKNTVGKFIVSKQSEYPITLNTFANTNELLCHINRYGGFDLLILEAILPDMNGIELAAEIRKTDTDCKIIFLTSAPEFAVDSYKVGAYSYLLKNCLSTELTSLLDKALEEIKEEDSGSIVIKEKEKLTRIPIHKIRYIESINHTVYFHMHGNQSLSCLKTMNEVHDNLLAHQQFIKCHKSFMVNMSYVTSITNKDLIMDDDTQIPISRQVYRQVKDAFLGCFCVEGNERKP